MERKIIRKMNQMQIIIVIILGAIGQLFAATSVKVYSSDEALGESNISKPRIYIQNNGTTTLDHYDYYYSFTIENGVTPVLEDYYTPDAEVSLQPISTNEYRLKYHVTGVNFAPGQVLPGTSGNIVGLHYNDWAPWDKTNDYSNKQSSIFVENNRISVYVDGLLIYGETIGATSGSLTCEVWNSITGSLVSQIPVNTPFHSVQTLSSFEETNHNVNYGTRIRGYLTAPVSGVYYFWLAGDDNCELWLSTNDRPENRVQIANVPYWTNSQQWDKYTSQKSSPITLAAGQRYYIESLHKQGSGGDNLAVGWLKPGQSGNPAVITGDVLTPFILPNATPSLTAAPMSPTQINLSWNDNCTNEDGYRVERSVSGGAYSLLVELGSNATNYQNTGLTAGTVYSYRVRAYNSQGYSPWSNVFMLTTQESTSGAVILEKWSGLSTDGEISASPLSNTPATTILTSLEEPAYNEDGFETRVRGYITAPASGVYTFWIRGDDDCEFYLSTSTSPASATRICNVDGWTTTTEWNKYTSQKSSEKNLVVGQKYYFQILHKEGTGNNSMAVGWLKPGESGSIPSQVIPGSVLSKFIEPVAPSNLTATAVSGSQINLVWSDNSDNEENFIIEQSLDGTTFSQVASKDPNTTSASITGLMPATTYTFHVKSINSKGSSAWSATAATATQQSTAGAISRQIWMSLTAGTGVARVPVATTPFSEVSLPKLQETQSGWDNFGTRVCGYLTAPSSGDYTFWVSGDDDCEFWLSTSEDPSAKIKIAYFTTWTNQLQYDKFPTQKSSPVSLTAGNRYYIEVLHIDNNGPDHMAVEWSKPGESTTAPTEIIPGSVLSMFVKPATPTMLPATTVSSTQIDLSWIDNADNETGYLIERALANQAFTQVATVAGGVTSYASTGLSPNSQYQFRVRATNYKGYSDYSNIATSITGAPGDEEGPILTPQLLSFAIYSQDVTDVGNSSIFSGGGAVGSNTFVKIGNQAEITGDIVCGGNVELWDRAIINGDITCSGTMTYNVSAPPKFRTLYEHASVTTVDIPEKPPIAYGTTVFPVNLEQHVSIYPGSYESMTVPRGAVVTFYPGIYNFKSLTIGNYGTVIFDIPMDKTVEINVETFLKFENDATAKFITKGYAPSVKIYTNAYEVYFGNTVKLTGILTAPHAAVTIQSRTAIEGAVYAKSISLSPEAVFLSSYINPNDDGDGDCVPNLTEMMLNDAPDDGEDYTLVAVPHPAMIDNSKPEDVTYNFGCKYPDIPCEWTLTYPADCFINTSVAPAFTLSNKPFPGIPEFTKNDYKPVGNYMRMVANGLKPKQAVRVALPLFAGAQPSLNYSIAWYNSEETKWEVTSATQLGTCALLTDYPIKDLSSLIIVQGGSTMVAYLNDGMVYSNETKVRFRLYGQISAPDATNPGADPGSITINYLEHTPGNPAGVPGTPLVCPIINYKNMGTLLINKEYEFANKITVTGIQINSPNFLKKPYSITNNFVIKPGQNLSFNINRTTRELDNVKITGDLVQAYYDVNAMTFESMAFADGVITSDAGTWGYDFYLKDHLGSTRMVLNQSSQIKDALMYQPYGTVSDVEEISGCSIDPLRQKFTNKELDEEGVSPDEQRLYMAIVIGMPDANYTGSFTTKRNTVSETEGNILYNEHDAAGNPTLQCFMSTTMETGEYYEYIEIKLKNTASGTIYTYRLDGVNWAGETGRLKKYTLDRSFSDIQSAIGTGANLFIESGTLIGVSRMNLVYFGKRYLDPEVGMFPSTDPAEQFWSTYSFTGCNPVNFVDPDGQTTVLKEDGSYEFVFDGKGFDVATLEIGADKGVAQEIAVPIEFTTLEEINTEIINMRSFFKEEMGSNLWNMIGGGFISIATKGADTRYAEATDIPNFQKTHYIVQGFSKWYRSNELNYIGIGGLYKVNPLIGKFGMLGDIYTWKFTQWKGSVPSKGTLFWANYGYDYEP